MVIIYLLLEPPRNPLYRYISNPDRRKMHAETKRKMSLPASAMPLSFGRFSSANTPSNFASNLLPTPTGEMEYLCSILPRPPKKRASALSLSEAEDANASVDAMLAEGDDKGEKPMKAADSGTEWWLVPAKTTDGETRKRRRKSSTPRRFIAPGAAAPAVAVPPALARVEAWPVAPARVEALPVAPATVEALPVAPARVEGLPVAPATVEAWPVAPATVEALPVAPERVEAWPVAPARVEAWPVAPARVEALPVAPARVEAVPVAPARLAIEALLVVPVYLAPDDRLAERPDFLSDDWIVIERTRRMGMTAGRKDKYYIHRPTGRKLRSLEQVRCYLETGSAKKPRKTAEKGDSDVAEGDANVAEAKSTTPAKKSKKKNSSKKHEVMMNSKFL